TLDGVVTAGHVSDDGVVIVRVEPSSIADLTARLSVERRMVENDFAFLSGFEFLKALAAFHDRQHFATVGSRLPVAFEHRGWQLLIGGIGGLLGGTFPGGASTLALLGHGTVETGLIKFDALVTGRILHEIERHAKGVVKFKGFLASVDCL